MKVLFITSMVLQNLNTPVHSKNTENTCAQKHASSGEEMDSHGTPAKVTHIKPGSRRTLQAINTMMARGMPAAGGTVSRTGCSLSNIFNSLEKEFGLSSVYAKDSVSKPLA